MATTLTIYEASKAARRKRADVWEARNRLDANASAVMSEARAAAYATADAACDVTDAAYEAVVAATAPAALR